MGGNCSSKGIGQARNAVAKLEQKLSRARRRVADKADCAKQKAKKYKVT